MTTYRDELVELRDLLKGRLDDAPASALAPIAKQYAETIREIAAMDATRPAEGSKIDELRVARERRRAKAASQQDP